jgi:hypothetical protein
MQLMEIFLQQQVDDATIPKENRCSVRRRPKRHSCQSGRFLQIYKKGGSHCREPPVGEECAHANLFILGGPGCGYTLISGTEDIDYITTLFVPSYHGLP